MNGSSNNKNPETNTAETAALDLGDETIPEEAREAIRLLISEINALREEIEANNDRIAELETLADRDPLVPVVNRRAFVRELSRAKAYAERYGGTNCLLYLDIDGMKLLNDQHGHATGDAALTKLADILQKIFAHRIWSDVSAVMSLEFFWPRQIAKLPRKRHHDFRTSFNMLKLKLPTAP